MPTKRRIWVVEPMAGVHGFLTTSLEDAGNDVQVFSEAQEVLDAARTSRPDLLIVDLDRPSESACLTTCDPIIRSPLLEGVRFLAIDRPGGHDGCQGCLACGAEDYLTRPLDLLDVKLRVRDRLRAAAASESRP